eukprot:m.171052 g.171052  ORF g.171052 m.171052 type:complete len:116 (+) comp15282_c2_seq2:959-1306(+)
MRCQCKHVQRGSKDGAKRFLTQSLTVMLLGDDIRAWYRPAPDRDATARTPPWKDLLTLPGCWELRLYERQEIGVCFVGSAWAHRCQLLQSASPDPATSTNSLKSRKSAKEELFAK